MEVYFWNGIQEFVELFFVEFLFFVKWILRIKIDYVGNICYKV